MARQNLGERRRQACGYHTTPQEVSKTTGLVTDGASGKEAGDVEQRFVSLAYWYQILVRVLKKANRPTKGKYQNIKNQNTTSRATRFQDCTERIGCMLAYRR